MVYKRIQMFFFLGLLVAAALLTVYLFLPYLSALVLGGTFAIIFRPLYRRILSEFRGRESLAALVCAVLLVIAVLAPIIFFGTRLFFEASELLGAISGGGGNFAGAVAGWFDRYLGGMVDVSVSDVIRYGNQYAAQTLSWLVENLGGIFSKVASIFLALFLSLLSFYYVLKDGHRLKEVLVLVSPLADQYDKEIFGKLYAVVNSVIKGTLVVAVAQGLLAGIGFFIFGVPSPVLWGVIAVIAALIPIVGTAIVTLPGVFYLVVTGAMVPAVGLLIWSLLLVGAIDNFLKPKLIGRGIEIHPFLVLLAVLGGIHAFGPMGFVIGPLILSLLLALLDIYQREFKEYISQQS